MRIPIVPIALALVAAVPLSQMQVPPLYAQLNPELSAPVLVAGAPSAQIEEYLPNEASIARVLAPMTVSNYQLHRAEDGWDLMTKLVATGGAGGGPDVPVMISIAGSELPTVEGAAGFVQTKLQQYRDATRVFDLIGELGPAGETLTMDADEAYFGAYLSTDGANPRILTAVLIARYEYAVTAVEATMVWDSAGTINQESQTGLGMITGALAALVNELSAE